MKPDDVRNVTLDPKEWAEFWKTVNTTTVKPVKRALKKRIAKKRKK